MKSIVDWLIEMETLAGDFYREAAETFGKEEKLSGFLRTLAQDEYWHKELVEKAGTCVNDAEFQPPFNLDEETIMTFMRPFTVGREVMAKHMFTRDKLIDCIIETEFSEWNPIFLYVVNFVSKNVAECFDIAPKIQLHEKYIRKFIEMDPEFLVQLEKFKDMPLAWRDKILIVDDEPVILSLLKSMFEADWSVETAANGSEALEKMRYSYFDVILSDINMQKMNGITLYMESKKIRADMGERFLFYSGNVMSYPDFFRGNNVKYLTKPATVKELRRAVFSIAHKDVDARLA